MRFDAEVWDWKGDGSWHFVTLPGELADDIKAITAGRAKGFGSVPVKAAIGQTRFETSLFPDTKSGSYLLPLKKAVRAAEGLAPGVTATVSIELR